MFAVWIPGVLDDFDSSTQAAYNFLVPFSINDSLVFTKRLFGNPLTGFEAFLGTAGVGALLFGFAAAVAGTAIGLRRRFESAAKAPRVRPEVVLIGALAIAGPVGCVLGSISGTNMYLPRNFSASLPAILIALSALSLAGPIVYRAASIGLLLVGFAIGTVRIVSDAWQRPASRLATAFVDSRAEPGELVIEATPFPVGVAVESPDGTFVSSLSIEYEQGHPRVDYSQLSDEVKQRLASGGYGDDVFLIGDGQTLASVREQLGLPAPAPEDVERFDGVFELTVEQVPVPATPPAAE